MQSSVIPQIQVKSVSKKQIEKENKKIKPQKQLQSPMLKVFGDSSNKVKKVEEEVQEGEKELKQRIKEAAQPKQEDLEVSCPLKDHF